MKIALGCDHAAYNLKVEIIKHLKELGHTIFDCGAYSEESVDYPSFGAEVGRKVASKEADLGIICCGSGEGISIACNKIKGIRCGIGYNDEVSGLIRKHNDANVISFGARFMAVEDVLRRVDIFLTAEFEGGRHERRVKQIEELEK